MAQQRATLSPLPTHLIEALDNAFALKPADDPHMRTFRRNGWQRIGIILSVLWVLVGAWLAQQSVYAPVRAGHSKCISLGVTPSICKAELDKGIARKKEELQGAIAVFALAPIALVWLIIWIVRRVRRVFQPAS